MSQRAGELRRHLLEELLPTWRDYGLDRQRGGWFLRLTPELERSGGDYQRLVVQTRQLYSFSHASCLGADWALDVARLCHRHLLDRFRDERHGGWFFTTDLDGEPLDRRKDLYAHAFVLFGLAWYARASRDPAALEAAQETLELLDTRLADPKGGGYFEGASETWEPVSEPRRQNPHMHLFEALLAWYEVDGDDAWLARARELMQLFERRFFDAERGILGEYFGEDWSPLPAGDSRRDLVQPGHHFEWVWLLHRFAAQSGDRAALDPAGRLFDFAKRHGVKAERCAVLDGVDRDGRVVDGRQRVWPQTEYLKALAVRFLDLEDAGAFDGLEATLEVLFRERVVAGCGGWRERLDLEGRVVEPDFFASSVYHITLGLAETMRALEAPDGAAR